MIDLIADDSTQTIVTMSGDTRELPTVSRELKFQAAKEVAQYLEPKLRATEISGDPDRPLIVQHYEVTLE